MSRAVRILCATLFLGTTTCSLIFSASATIAKAASVHVPPGVTWSAIGFLELLSLAGTMRWLTATTSRGRTHAVLIVAAVAAVTAQAGWSFYGWWGVLAPLAVVGTVHMVAETLRDVRPEPEPATVRTVVQAPVAPSAKPASGTSALVYRLWSATDDLLYIGSTSPGELGLRERLYCHRAKPWGKEIDHWTVEEFSDRDAAYHAEARAIRAEKPRYNAVRYGTTVPKEQGPVYGPLTLLETARAILARKPDSSERALRDELSVSRHQVRKLLIEIRSGLSQVAS